MSEISQPHVTINIVEEFRSISENNKYTMDQYLKDYKEFQKEFEEHKDNFDYII